MAKRVHTKAATPIHLAVFKKKKQHQLWGVFVFTALNFQHQTLSEALADSKVLFEKVDDCNGICETTDITGVKITLLSFCN